MLDQNILQMLEQDAIKFTQRLVRINTIRDVEHKSIGKPFGPGIDQGFDEFIKIAQEIGMDTFKDPNGFYAYAEVGPKDKKMVGILAHIDTVGIGDVSQWTQAQPFSADIVDDKIIGRGSLDDKGPLAINLAAIKHLISSGYEFNSNIRIVVGGAEETTWEGINAYKAHEKLPDISYSPDSNFPLINGEQTIIQYKISSSDMADFTVETNNSINAVCDKVIYQGTQIMELSNQENMILEDDKIIVNGVSAHAMECFKGDNAINRLVSHLTVEHNLIKFIKDNLLDVYGKDLFTGITYEDMRLNMGNLIINENESYVQIDMRLPLNTNVEDLIAQLEQKVSDYNLKMELIKKQPQLYLAPDSVIVKTLLDVYVKCVPEAKEIKPLTIGGGTYARALDNCVAFGLVFSEFNMDDKMHQPNECLEIKFIKTAIDIYTNAIMELDKIDL